MAASAPCGEQSRWQEQRVWEAVEEVAPQIAVNDWVRGWRLADPLDRTRDLSLERVGRARAAFEIPDERGAGLLLGVRLDLDRKGHRRVPQRAKMRSRASDQGTV